MKKWAGLLFILAVVAAMGLGIFLLTFEADRYRPLAIQKISELLGKRVRIGKMAVTWRAGGIAISIEDFAILSETETPLFSAQKAHATLEPLSLLGRDFRLGALEVERPEMKIIRLSEGEIKVRGFEEIGKKKEGEEMGGSSLWAVFLVDTIKIRQGQLQFQDEMQTPPGAWVLESAEIEIGNFSLTGPIQLRAQGAFLSETQNAELKTVFFFPQAGRSARLENVSLDLDLSAIGMPELIRALPLLQKIGFRERPAGKINVRAESLPLERNEFREASLDFRLTEATIAPATLALPLERLTAEVTYEKDRLEVRRLEFDFAQGRFQGSAEVHDLSSQADGRFQIQGEEFDLSRLAENTDPRLSRPSGILNFSLEGSAQGRELAVISQTLQGEGTLSIREPVLRNLNLVREVLSRLSLIPGLVDRLLGRLPPEYQARLEASDTVFSPIQIPFSVAGGKMNFPRIELVSESFAFNAQGGIAPNGHVVLQGMLTLDPYFSEAFMRSVEELRYLADSEGRIQIPLVIQGVLPRLQILPDLTSAASRLAVVKAQEWIAGLLGGNAPKAPADPSLS